MGYLLEDRKITIERQERFTVTRVRLVQKVMQLSFVPSEGR